ncbi:MAG: hypothetical protein AAF657_00210 [Acidobacteriota bacterium]
MERFDRSEILRRRTPMQAKLIFDTASRAMAAGTRRSGTTSRHLLYEVEDFCLDIRLDKAPQSAAATIVGQLADRKDPLKPLSGLPVYLVAGDELLAATRSNRLGEFQVEYEAADAMSLCLPFGEEQLIEVPVEPHDDGAAT